jgi:hypothetical protein
MWLPSGAVMTKVFPDMVSFAAAITKLDIFWHLHIAPELTPEI